MGHNHTKGRVTCPAMSQTAHPQPHVEQSPPPKKKKRIFLWIFLAVQLLFIVWIIGGIASAGGDPSDCGSLSKQACNDAEDIGTGIGIAFVIVFWCIVDFLLAVGYGVYRLAKRT